MTVLSIEHIVQTPEIGSGKPRISGTRMRVQDVVYYHHAGWSIDTISDEFGLTPGQIHAALSYYFDHQAEIDADLRYDEESAQALMASDDYKASKAREQQIKAMLEQRKANP